MILKERSGNEDETSIHALIPLAYAGLHRLAEGYFRNERGDHTLQTTALVHEAYLRIAHHRGGRWKNREQLLGVSAHAMRRVLIDHAHRRGTRKRGGDRRRCSLDEAAHLFEERVDDLAALDEALRGLEARDPEKSRMVELRFFGGLSVPEIAKALGVPMRRVERGLRFAKAWLRKELAEP